MSRPVVISLCDLTGNGVRPWVDAGCDAYLVDPQHEVYSSEVTPSGGTIHRIPKTVIEALAELAEIVRTREVIFVAGYPPCDDMAVSGARWFKAKEQADPAYFAKAAAVAEQCRTFAIVTGAPYFIENPVSRLSRVFGKASHIFNPWEYTALEPSDNYNKRTCLWTGGGFVMPPRNQDTSLGAPDNRIHAAPPGPERSNFRSATPMGFARAVFLANFRPALQAVAA